MYKQRFEKVGTKELTCFIFNHSIPVKTTIEKKHHHAPPTNPFDLYKILTQSW